MELSLSQQTTIRYQFEFFCKKVIDGERCDYLRELSRRASREISFSELSEDWLDHLMIESLCPVDQYRFNVCGYPVAIQSDRLAEALLDIGAETYSILLLAYCLEFSDREIGILLGQARSSVQRRRQQSLVELKSKLRR